MHNNKIRKDGYSVLYMCCNGGKDLFMLMGENWNKLWKTSFTRSWTSFWPRPYSGSNSLVSQVLQGRGITNRPVGVAHTAHIWPDGLQHGAGSQVGSWAARMTSISSKQTVPVAIVPPSLTSRGHTGWLGHICHGCVGLGQLVLNTFKGAEDLMMTTVLGVSISLAPS